jgi:hypothetical protein
MKTQTICFLVRKIVGLTFVSLALSLGCGGSSHSGAGGASGGGGRDATGGAGGGGGAAGTGGRGAGTGGASGTGGAVGTGGAPATGGSVGSGGSVGTGGGAGTGVGGMGTGGAGTGGMGTGGAGTGGAGTGGMGTGGAGTGGDMTGGAGGAGGAGGGAGGAGGACASLKINEVLVATSVSADQEFVELYNPCATPVDLTGYRLVYRAAQTLIDTTVANFTTGTIAPLGFWIVGSYDPNATRDTTFALTVHFDGTAGGVGLRNPSGTLVDSVGYGTGVTNQLIEGGLAAAAPPAGQSIVRRPDGRDTNSNVVDFSLSAIPSPHSTNF